ncbi:TonB-dependent receptor [Leptospira sp. GIMC2001]|nr:TonB-dependent receptor [Leptospira sp. GIMC2001]WCL50025.1 TonB-dependent receptor [Leptospira sp. GIMC2001]
MLSQDNEVKAEKIEIRETKTNSKNENFDKNKSGMNSEILLEEAKTRYSSLPEILEREAGLRVRSYGGLGSYSTLSIRGTNPNQSRFYIDGIPFNSSQSGEVNLADLPFDNLESVEVYRSGVPVGFSGSAIGGIVNLKSMKPLRRTTRLNIGGGSFNTGRTSISHSDINESKTLGYTVFGLMEKSDQNFSFLNDRGTILLNTIDDSIDRRKNAQFERAQTMGSVFWSIGKTDLRLVTDLNHRRQGIPGPGNNQTEKTSRKYSRLLTAISSDTQELFYDWLRLENRLYYTGFRDEFYDPRSEFSSGRPNAQTNSETIGFQTSPTLYLLDYYQIVRISGGAEKENFRRDRRNFDHMVLEKEPIRNRNYLNASIEDEIRLFDAKLLLTPGVSFDEYRDTWQNDRNYIRKTTQFTNPRMGFLWKIWKGESQEIKIRANANISSRIPAFLELFGERGQILGNENLKPERSENRDVGIVYDYEFWGILNRTEISWFKKMIRDMILFVPNSQFSLRAENIDGADIQGIETGHSMFWKSWKLRTNYTYQIAKNRSASPNLNGKFLPLRPMHELYSSLTYSLANWQIGGEFTYIGAVFRDRTNEYVNYLPARDIYGAFVSYSLWKGEKEEELKVSFEVKNILNKQFSDIIGYPLPGRIWYCNLDYKF